MCCGEGWARVLDGGIVGSELHVGVWQAVWWDVLWSLCELHVLWEQRLWGVVCGGEVGSELCSREGGT